MDVVMTNIRKAKIVTVGSAKRLTKGAIGNYFNDLNFAPSKV